MRRLMLAGMNVARLNFSHGAHEDHAKVVVSLREIAAELGRPLAIMGDLPRESRSAETVGTVRALEL